MAGLGDSTVAAVLRADDLTRAKRFYTEILGLSQGPSAPGGEFFLAGKGTAIMVYERRGMPAPANTTLGFSVESEQFEAVVHELRDKGVVFEEYDMPEMGLKTVEGVATVEGIKSAWFKDTEGNILNIATR
jgi:catechol 2,3-dioxygenase-like lactoylglutathione lyase family enzyme